MTATVVAASPAHPIPPIRVGLCGIGRTGMGRIRSELAAMGDAYRIVAGHDAIVERAVQLAQLTGCVAHPTYEGLLADPAVEVVVVATRSDTHAEMALRALTAGKHVVVEKPMATRLADADRMVAAAARSTGRLFVRHNRRFDPPFRLAMDVLASGNLGRLFSAQLRVGEYVRRTDWQTLRECGGGQLLNWGPHVIDWAVQLAGGEVADVWSDLQLIAAGGDAEDHVKLLLRGRTGAVIDVEISGAASIKQPAWLLQGDRGGLVIDGDTARLRYLADPPPQRGRLRASGDTPGQDDKAYKGGNDTKWVEEVLSVVGVGPADGFWGALQATLRRGRPFPITLAEAREVMRVIEVARAGTEFVQ